MSFLEDNMKSILESKKIFKEKQIKEIIDMDYDFKQVKNYNMFIKLNIMKKELKKIISYMESISI